MSIVIFQTKKSYASLDGSLSTCNVYKIRAIHTSPALTVLTPNYRRDPKNAELYELTGPSVLGQNTICSSQARGHHYLLYEARYRLAQRTDIIGITLNATFMVNKYKNEHTHAYQ